jgi:hypothetical protein
LTARVHIRYEISDIEGRRVGTLRRARIVHPRLSLPGGSGEVPLGFGTPAAESCWVGTGDHSTETGSAVVGATGLGSPPRRSTPRRGSFPWPLDSRRGGEADYSPILMTGEGGAGLVRSKCFPSIAPGSSAETGVVRGSLCLKEPWRSGPRPQSNRRREDGHGNGHRAM